MSRIRPATWNWGQVRWLCRGCGNRATTIGTQLPGWCWCPIGVQDWYRLPRMATDE